MKEEIKQLIEIYENDIEGLREWRNELRNKSEIENKEIQWTEDLCNSITSKIYTTERVIKDLKRILEKGE